MNEIAKRSAVERLHKAMELEKISTSETARQLNILPQYLSMALNEKTWDKLSKAAWDRILFWCNSGETIRHFKIPTGEAIVQSWKKKSSIQLPPKVIGRIATQDEAKKIIDSVDKITAPLAVEKASPDPGQDFTDTARLKVCLDIEINLVINGQKVQVK